MKEFTITYKSGKTEMIACPDKHTLIEKHFGGEKKFRSEVSRLTWSSLAIQYVEDVQSRQGYAQIVTADVNPYGWRNA